jgi:hypothetical protein
MLTARAIALVLALAGAGCATAANYERTLARWKGVHVNELTRSWGPPTTRRPSASGGTEVEYVVENRQPVGMGVSPARRSTGGNQAPNGAGLATGGGGQASGRPRESSGDVLLSRCVTRFAVDANGIVQSWTYEGNGCVAVTAE